MSKLSTFLNSITHNYSCKKVHKKSPLAWGWYVEITWWWQPESLNKVSTTELLNSQPWSEIQTRMTPYLERNNNTNYCLLCGCQYIKCLISLFCYIPWKQFIDEHCNFLSHLIRYSLGLDKFCEVAYSMWLCTFCLHTLSKVLWDQCL